MKLMPKAMERLKFCCLQANMLACYWFINAVRRHTTSGSESKNFITCCRVGSIIFKFMLIFFVKSYRGDAEWPRTMLFMYMPMPIGHKHICLNFVPAGDIIFLTVNKLTFNS